MDQPAVPRLRVGEGPLERDRVHWEGEGAAHSAGRLEGRQDGELRVCVCVGVGVGVGVCVGVCVCVCVCVCVGVCVGVWVCVFLIFLQHGSVCIHLHVSLTELTCTWTSW